jgi:hypothetical protein
MTQFFPSDQRTIGSRTFIVTACNTDDGCRLLFSLIKVCGPAVARFLRGLGADEESLEDMNLSIVADALEELLRTVDKATFDDFYKTFFKNTKQLTDEGGQVPLVGPTAFAGDYGTMSKWLAFSLEVNFASFLADLAAIVPHVSPAAGKANRSRPKSTGGSTE